MTDHGPQRQPASEMREMSKSPLAPDERRMAVLFAETISFTQCELGQLLPLLAAYIDEYRFKTDQPETLVALQAAIRKYAMNMQPSDFDRYANWLSPTETSALSSDVELELAKGVAARLTYGPPVVDGSESLFAALEGLATDYLSVRLLLKEKYAAIAVNAVVGSFLLAARAMQRERIIPLAQKLSRLKLGWFTSLVRTRIETAVSVNRSQYGAFSVELDRVAAKLR